MIARPVIEEFLARKLEDWTWVKDLVRNDMLKEVKEIAPTFTFKTKPFTHQLACFLIGLYNPKFLFLLDMGLGKTKIVLDLLSYYKQVKKIKRTLVLVPSPVNIYGFADEVHAHSNLSCVELYGTKNERWHILETTNADLYILNYMGLQSMIMEKAKAENAPRYAEKSAIEKFVSMFDSLIMDEIHKVKNHKTLTYKLVQHISKSYKLKYGLTGTPMGRDSMDLWAQFSVIDNGETLGRTISLYREAFYITKINYWGGYEYTLDPKKEKLLNTTIRNKSIRYDETEVKELPERIDRKVKVRLSIEGNGYYQTAVRGLIAVKGDYRNIDAIFIRLRQICSGFIGHNLDEEQEKVLIDFKENPKLEVLMDLLSSIPATSKVIIFHEYIHSGNMIAKALEKEKIGYARLYGGTRDKKGALDSFLNEKKRKVFLVNSASGGTGLNLQVANYVIYYESPVSPIVRKQSEKRVYRTGQSKRTFFYDLVVEHSVEEKILQYLAEGKDLFRAVVEGKATL